MRVYVLKLLFCATTFLLIGQTAAAQYVYKIRADTALAILDSARVRTFQYKADTAGVTHIGFIADEVSAAMAAPGRQGVEETNTVALLVKAMQEMKATMEQQQQQVTALKKQVETLQQQLNNTKRK